MTRTSGSPAGRPKSKTARAAKPLTVGRLLDEAERRLKKADVEYPDASALWLLASVKGELGDPDAMGRRRSGRVSAADAARFRELVARRERHEPFQYIVGVTDFRGKLMEIEKDVFVPREQTERMCDEIEVWARGRKAPRGGWRIADLGTGSGAMAVSLAVGPMKPRRVYAVDISTSALQLVRKNARRHGVSKIVRTIAGDWLSMFPPEPCLDVICAVPPYLNPGDEIYVSEESLLWEPMESFFGYPTGDVVLRQILDEAALRLRPGGLMALQADSDQIPGLVEYVNDDPKHPLAIEWILHDGADDEDAILAVKL